jgi:macrolide transport system ATP-binding/permease protein
MREFFRRLHFFFHREQFERELEEEMQHHLELTAEEHGSNDSARQKFGNITLLKEDSRAMWSWRLFDQLKQDVRYAVRAMGASPLFTAMAVLSLALGIGANIAIYSFLDAILLRSLPVSRPEELVVLKWRAKAQPAVIHGHSGIRNRDKTGLVSPNYPYPAYEFLRSDSSVLSTLFAYATAWRINIVAQKQAEVGSGQLVSGSFYRSLGVSPVAGRLIDEEDDRAGAEKVAVLSYPYWQSRYASDPAAVGQSIRINDVPFTIIGVSPPEFFGVNPGMEYQVYLPLHAAPSLAPRPAEDEKRRFFDRNFYWVEMMGRLRPGVSRTQAESALAGEFRQYAESTASTAGEKTNMPELWLMDGAGGLDSLRRQYSQPVYVLMAMVALILAISCANIANLLLVRATARRREIAVRLSLGAGRMRLIRQLLTESILLAMTGAALGLLVAVWGIRSITLLLANGMEDFTLHAELNWGVLAFTCALALLTGILFGLAPAIQATKVNVTPALKETRASAPSARSHRISLSRVLVTLQVALSLLLVVGAGLFVRTLSNLHSIELGFNEQNVLLFSVNARQAGYKEANLARFYDDLLRRFRGIPGVMDAGASQFSLVANYWNSTRLVIPGAQSATTGPKTETCILPVDPAFLQTMQIPVVLGSGIEERHMTSPNVGVINEEFAKKFFEGGSPIGRRILLGDQAKQRDIEIIGVAKTARYNSIKEKTTPPLVYVPYTQDLAGLGGMFFELRTAGDPLAMIPTVRRLVREANASVPVANVNTQTAQIDQTISKERTFGQLCASFAVLALIIACIGLYGTMAYTVARRTGEIGIRMALGAERAGIIAMVLREVFALAAAGIAIGLGLAWATTRFVESFLFGLKHNDPFVLSLAVATLAGAAILAGYAPARRASRVDPAVALRHE